MIIQVFTDFYVTPAGRASQDAYRAMMVAEFEARSVSLPTLPGKPFTPTPAAPAVAPQEIAV